MVSWTFQILTDSFAFRASAQQQPLLGGSRNEPAECSSSRPKEALSEDEQRQQQYNANAQRLVKWTIWILLGAVLLGTILGTVLVSIPLQNAADPPGKMPSLVP